MIYYIKRNNAVKSGVDLKGHYWRNELDLLLLELHSHNGDAK